LCKTPGWTRIERIHLAGEATVPSPSIPVDNPVDKWGGLCISRVDRWRGASTRAVDNPVDGAGYIVDGEIALHRRRGRDCGHSVETVDGSPRLSTYVHIQAKVIPRHCQRSPQPTPVVTALCAGVSAHGKPLCRDPHGQARRLSPPSTPPTMTAADSLLILLKGMIFWGGTGGRETHPQSYPHRSLCPPHPRRMPSTPHAQVADLDARPFPGYTVSRSRVWTVWHTGMSATTVLIQAPHFSRFRFLRDPHPISAPRL